MGLSISFDAWEGSYSSFGEWRRRIAEVIGIDLEQMEGFAGFREWDTLPEDPLLVLLMHSDCDGQIEVEDLLPLASRLEEILPLIDANDWKNQNRRISSWHDRTIQFIEGCRAGAEFNEPLDFH